MLAINTIHHLEAREGLRQLQDSSVDCVVTSPPYWQTRDYGIPPVKWNDGADSVLGLEPSCDRYVAHLLEVFAEVHRVLKGSGTLWVNLGDSYGAGRWSKCLMAVPERFVLGMLELGWILRNRIVWHKPCHMPESVKDRLTSSWEYLYFFVKSRRYWFDLDSVRQPHVSLVKHPKLAKGAKPRRHRSTPNIKGVGLPPNPGETQAFHDQGRNPGDYWSIAPETRSLGAMTGDQGCVKVPGGAGWLGHPPGGAARIIREHDPRWLSPHGKNPGDCWDVIPNNQKRSAEEQVAHFAVFPERLCERPILSGCPPGGVVLDPFVGSGTTAVVARRLGRNFIGFDLNADYVRLARQRLAAGDEGGMAAAA